MDDSASPIDIQLNDGVPTTIAPKIRDIADAAREANHELVSLQAQISGLDKAALTISRLTKAVDDQSLSYLKQESALNRAVKAENDAVSSQQRLSTEIQRTNAATANAEASLSRAVTAEAQATRASTVRQRSLVDEARAAQNAADAQEFYNQTLASQGVSTNGRAGNPKGSIAGGTMLAAQIQQEEQLAQSSAKAEAAEQRFMQQLKVTAETAGMSAADTLAYKAAQMGLTEQAAPMIKKLKDIELAENAVAHGASGMSLATRESVTLVREAINGNYTRMVGSSTLLLQALGALKYLLSPQVLIPAATIGAFVAFEVVMENDRVATSKLSSEMIGIGARMGTTAKQFDEATAAGMNYGRMSIGSSRDLAEAYLKSGTVGGDVLIKLTGLTQTYANKTGQSTQEASQDLIKLFADPIKGAQTLNSQLGILTATQYENVVALQKAGDTAGAQRVIVDALKLKLNELEDAVKEQIPWWKAWATQIANSFREAIGAAGGGTLTAQLKQAQEQLAFDKSHGTGAQFGLNEQVLADDKKKVDDLTASLNKFNAAQAKTHIEASRASILQTGIDLANSLDPNKELKDLAGNLSKASNAFIIAKSSGKESADTMKLLGDNVQRLSDTYHRYIPQAQLEVQIAALTRRENAATNSQEKSTLATKLEALKLNNQLLTNSELQQKAAISGAAVAGKGDKAAAIAAEQHSAAIDKITTALKDEEARMSLIKPLRDAQAIADRYEVDMAGKKIKMSDAEKTAILAKANAIIHAREVETAYDAIYDKFLKPMDQYRATLEAITLALQQHTITQERATALQKSAGLALTAALNPTAKTIADLKAQDQQLGLVGDSYEIETKLYQEQLKAIEAGNPIKETELKKLREEYSINMQLARVHGELDTIYKQTTGAYLQLLAKQQALNIAQRAGKITSDQYTQGLVSIWYELNKLNLETGHGNFTDALRQGMLATVKDFKGLLPTLAADFENFFTQLQDGFANTVGQIATGQTTLSDGFHQLAQQILSELIGSLVKLGIQWVTMQLVGQSAAAAGVAASAAQGASLAVAWEPAALSASIATFGSADAVGLAAYEAAMAAGKVTAAVGSIGFAGGGKVSGPGGPRDDKISANLSNGEFVVNADATAKNLRLLQIINSGIQVPTYGKNDPLNWLMAASPSTPHFAGGGYVQTAQSQSGPVKLPVHVKQCGGPEMDFDATMFDDRIEIIATKVADKRISNQVPKIMSKEAHNPNSTFSKTMRTQTSTKQRLGG